MRAEEDWSGGGGVWGGGTVGAVVGARSALRVLFVKTSRAGCRKSSRREEEEKIRRLSQKSLSFFVSLSPIKSFYCPRFKNSSRLIHQDWEGYKPRNDARAHGLAAAPCGRHHSPTIGETSGHGTIIVDFAAAAGDVRSSSFAARSR